MLSTNRFGLNRYLKNPRTYDKKFDIIIDEKICVANENFCTAMIKLKRKGKGNIVHHPKINETDKKWTFQQDSV